MPLLLLFDCDGTLFLSDDPVAQDAMIEALECLTDARVSASMLDELDHSARTARWIAREVVARHALRKIDLAQWADLVEGIYHQRLPADTDWAAPPGTADALRELQRDGFRLAMLTGVPKRIVQTRLKRLGLAEFFQAEEGAYGSEVEERTDLIRLALARAGAQASDAVEIGDTSRDVRCANELGLHTIATAFDGAHASHADEAEEAVRSMPQLVDAVRDLAARESRAPRARSRPERRPSARVRRQEERRAAQTG